MTANNHKGGIIRQSPNQTPWGTPDKWDLPDIPDDAAEWQPYDYDERHNRPGIRSKNDALTNVALVTYNLINFDYEGTARDLDA